MRTQMISLIAWAVAVAGCTGSEPGRQTQGAASKVSGQATERWSFLRTSQGMTVHIDSGRLTTRADTVRVRARVIRGGDTTKREFEIACGPRRFLAFDRDAGWRPITQGVSAVLAESLCESTPPR